MKRNEQYRPEGYEKLLELIDSLDSNSVKNAKELLSTFDNIFQGDSKNIDYMLTHSKELETLYVDLVSKFNEINEKIEISNEATEKFLKKNKLTKDELDKIIKNYEKLKKLENDNKILQKNVAKIDKELTKPNLDPNKVIELQNKKGNIINEINANKSEIGKIKSKNFNKVSERQVAILHNKHKEIEESLKDANELRERGNELQEKSVELTEKQQKSTNNLNKALQGAYGVLKQIISEGWSKFVEVDERIAKSGRQMGISTKQLHSYQKNVFDTYGDIASKLGMTFEEMFKFQEEYSKNTGRSIILTNKQVESLGAMSQMIGDVATNEMVKNMDDFGASTQTATSYLAVNMARARAQGLDAKKASEAFANNIKMASKYNFSDGVNGISKMTLLSQKLKFNMESIGNAADKFQTIESAIETSANLQVLGGSFASQFGNPLEAMNLTMFDMEGFTKKIIDTFQGKAYFNEKTGQVEMSSIDKRFLQEAAKSFGMDYKEAWNIATQQAKINAVESNINKNAGFTQEEIEYIANQSQFIDGKHQIVYFDANGRQQTKDVGSLKKEDIEVIRDNEDVERSIQGDVHGIHDTLKLYVMKQLAPNKSFSELKKGWEENRKLDTGELFDKFVGRDTAIRNTLTSGTMQHPDITSWGMILGGAISSIVGGIAFGNLKDNILKWNKKRYDNKLDELNDRTTNSSGKKGNIDENSKKGSKSVSGAQSTQNHTSKLGKFGGKLGKVGKLGLKGLVVAGAVASIVGMFSNNDDDEKNQVINEENNENNSILGELKIHTELLKIISEKQHVDRNTLSSISSYSNSVINDTNKGYDLENTLNSVSNTAFSTVTAVNMFSKQINSVLTSASNSGNGIIKKIGSKGLGAMSNVSKMAKAANPLGWVALGSDVLKEVSGVEEGSSTDKAWSTVNAALNGATTGAMIGSIIPGGTIIGGAVGGLIGGGIGIYNNYRDEISKKWDSWFGGDEETINDNSLSYNADIINKLSSMSVVDPQLQQEALIATCNINSSVNNIIKYLNELNKQNKVRNNTTNYSNVTNVGYNNIASKYGYYDDKVNTYLYGDEDYLSVISKPLYQKDSVNDISYNYNNNSNYSDVISKPTFGSKEEIRKVYERSVSNFGNDGILLKPLDLNINGTIKLVADNGNSREIDFNKLLSNDIFMDKLTNQLTSLLADEFSKRSNFGVSKDKNSVYGILGGGVNRNLLNG